MHDIQINMYAINIYRMLHYMFIHIHTIVAYDSAPFFQSIRRISSLIFTRYIVYRCHLEIQHFS